MERLVIETHALKRRRAVARDENVGFGQKPHHGLHAFFRLEVEGHPFPIEATAIEGGVIDVGLELHPPRHALRTLIVTTFAFDLVDGRP